MKTAIISLILSMTLCACGGGGGDSTPTPSPNVGPVANAGVPRVVHPGSEVLLDGSSSRDEDGEIVSYHWEQTTGSTVDLVDKDTSSARFVAPEADSREELAFKLIVLDDAGAQDEDDVPITVNIKPVADAGPDQTVTLSDPDTSTITLTGTSDDSDGIVVSHQWVQTGGPGVTLTGANTPAATFTVLATTQAYTFSYTVTDDDGAQQSDTITIFTTMIIFSDSFSDGSNWSSRWTDVTTGSPGNWIVDSGGLLQQNAVIESQKSYHTGTAAVLSIISGLSDYRFSVNITPLPNNTAGGESEGNDVGIIVRRQDDQNYYRVSMNAKQGFTRFERLKNGIFKTLAVNAIGYVENQPVTMTADVNGDTIVILIDGDPVFATVDDTIPSGTVALYCQDKARFDDVILSEPPLQPAIVVSSPLAYSVALTIDDSDTLPAKAVVLNPPPGGSVVFTLDGGSEIVATASGNEHSVLFTNVADGEHEVTAILRDADGKEVNGDINSTVGTGGDYYITVGDSITKGLGDANPWNNDSADGRIVAIQGYQAALADALTTTGRPQIVFNEGIGGDIASGLNSKISSILERHPGANKVLMMIGTNDSDIPVDPIDFNNQVANIAFKIDGIYNKEVWIAKPMPTYVKYTSTLDTDRNARLSLYNQKINEITTADPTDGIRLGPNFYTVFNNISLYADNLHPNDAGYQFMANEWQNKLP